VINKLAELSDTKKIALSVILIATVAIIIYSNSFYASFHFDDHPTIVENYTIHRFDLKEIFSTSSRPILDLTFALNYYFGKLDVFGYHLVNNMLSYFGAPFYQGIQAKYGNGNDASIGDVKR